MILSGANWYSFSLQNIYSAIINVIFYYLICALSNLTLSIKHKTSSKNKKFSLIMNRWMALTSLDILLRCETNFFPWNGITHNLRTSNIFDRFIIHSTNHVKRISALSYCSTLTGWGYPSFPCRLDSNFSTETFTLLHALNVALKTSCKFLS